MGKKKQSRKKSTLRRLLPFLVVGGIVYVAHLFRQVSNVLVGGSSTLIHKASLQGLELRTFLTVINQGTLTLTIQNFLGQILYQGREVGIVRLVRQMDVKPFETTQVEFSSEIGWAGLGFEFGDDLVKLWKAGKLPINLADFTIKGTLRAENLSIPINQKLLV